MKQLLPTTDDNNIGLIGHIIVNYPTPSLAYDSVATMVEAGVKLIELQIPFSEPVADGPTLMHANHRALANGVTVNQCFEFMEKVAKKFPIPFVFMSYGNIVYHHGFEKFVIRAKSVGAKGAIVPDLPYDITQDYLDICDQHDFFHAQLIPPNVTEERLVGLVNAATGFIYAVARSGVTGKHSSFNDGVITHLQNIRQHTELPIAVGFGVQSRADVEWLKPYADYAIIGSKALTVLETQGIDGLRKFWQGIADNVSVM